MPVPMPPTRPAILHLPKLALCAVALLSPLAPALTTPLSATAPPGKDRFEAKLKESQGRQASGSQPKAAAPARKAGRGTKSKHLTRRQLKASKQEKASGAGLQAGRTGLAPAQPPAARTLQELGSASLWHILAADDLAARYNPVLDGVSAAQIRERAAKLFADYSHGIWPGKFEVSMSIPSLEAIAKADLVRERLGGDPAWAEQVRRAEEVEKLIILHLQGFAEHNAAAVAATGSEEEGLNAARIASFVQALAKARPAGSTSAQPRTDAGAPPAPAPAAGAYLEAANTLAAAYVPRHTSDELMESVFPDLFRAPSARALGERTDQLFRQHGQGSDIRSMEPSLRPSVEGIAKCQLARETFARFRREILAWAGNVESKMGGAGAGGPGLPAAPTPVLGASILENVQIWASAVEEMNGHAWNAEGAIIASLVEYGRKRASDPATALEPAVQQFILNLQSAWRPVPGSGSVPVEAKASAPALCAAPARVAALPAPVPDAGDERRPPALADVFTTCADGSLLEEDDDAYTYPSRKAVAREFHRLKRRHLTRQGVEMSPGLESVLDRLAHLRATRAWFEAARRDRERHPERYAPEDTLLRFDRVIATHIAIEQDYIDLLSCSLARYVQERLAGTPADGLVPAQVAGWLRFVQSLRAVPLSARTAQPYWRKPYLRGWPLLPPWVKDEAEEAEWVALLDAEVVKEPGFTDEILEDARAAHGPERGRGPEAGAVPASASR